MRMGICKILQFLLPVMFLLGGCAEFDRGLDSIMNQFGGGKSSAPDGEQDYSLIHPGLYKHDSGGEIWTVSIKKKTGNNYEVTFTGWHGDSCWQNGNTLYCPDEMAEEISSDKSETTITITQLSPTEVKVYCPDRIKSLYSGSRHEMEVTSDIYRK